MELVLPGTWEARATKLHDIAFRVNNPSRCDIKGHEEAPLFVALTVASLSQENNICFCCHVCPHMEAAKTIGNNS